MLGLKSKLYYNSASYGSPTWVEVSIIADGTLNFAWDEGNADDRSDPAHRMVKTQFALEFTGNMKKKPTNTAYEYLMDLALSRGVGDFLVLDAAKEVVGARGFRFDGQLFTANEDQSMGNVIYNALSIKPTDSPDDNAVKAAKVASGPTLTYATIGDDSVSFS
jgi:hypothetical protein